MNITLYFVTTFIISALGSLLVGLITLMITQRTMEASKKAGYMLSFGATLIEFVYTYIALYGLIFFQGSVLLYTSLCDGYFFCFWHIQSFQRT